MEEQTTTHQHPRDLLVPEFVCSRKKMILLIQYYFLSSLLFVLVAKSGVNPQSRSAQQ